MENASRVARRGYDLWAWLGLTVFSGAYLFSRDAIGWIPHDEGMLGQPAERLLAGELPHRDFTETYTGGLTLLHAIAFKVFGVDSISLRYVLILAGMALTLAVFSLMRRHLNVGIATLGAIIALLWSFPNYFAGVPSWYVVTFWSLGLLMAMRFLEHERRVDLVLCGVFGGLAIAMKVSGVFFVCAIALVLVYRRIGAEDGAEGHVPSRWGTAVALLVSVLYAVGLLSVLKAVPTAGVMLNLALPNMVLAGYVAWWTFKARGLTASAVKRLLLELSLLGLGVTLVVGPIVALYAAEGALANLIHGVLVLPAKRTVEAVFPYPPTWLVLAALLPALGLAIAASWRGAPLTSRAVALWGAFVLALLYFAEVQPVYVLVFNSFRLLAPFLVIVAVMRLVKGSELDRRERESLFLFTAALSLGLLIQFPYAHPVYFCYVSAFAWLLVLKLTAPADLRLRRAAWATSAFYGAYAALYLNLGGMYVLGSLPYDPRPFTALKLDRASLIVPVAQADVWRPLIETVRSLSAPTDFIFAGPDAPEIYFLSARRNPTPILYEIFEEPVGLEARILEAIERSKVHVVVVNNRPEFSKPYSESFKAEVLRRLPAALNIGHFTVFAQYPPAIPGIP